MMFRGTLYISDLRLRASEYTLHTAHCTLHTEQFNITHYRLYTVHCPLNVTYLLLRPCHGSPQCEYLPDWTGSNLPGKTLLIKYYIINTNQYILHITHIAPNTTQYILINTYYTLLTCTTH